MKKELVPRTKIGNSVSIGAEREQDEIGLFVASADVSASCAVQFDESGNGRDKDVASVAWYPDHRLSFAEKRSIQETVQ